MEEYLLSVFFSFSCVQEIEFCKELFKSGKYFCLSSSISLIKFLVFSKASICPNIDGATFQHLLSFVFTLLKCNVKSASNCELSVLYVPLLFHLRNFLLRLTTPQFGSIVDHDETT